MITDLPPGFQESINATRRKPVQLAHIHIGDNTCFYSDIEIGRAYGLMHDYEPRVESWGMLKDTANIDASFTGSSLEVRSTTLTLILTGSARENFVDLLDTGIENSIVEIYQWFLDTPEEPPQLIDVFLAQDPIGFNEASALFTMDLVSMIMKNNPYLWAREPGEIVRDIVIGKSPNMPLIDLQTARWTTLDQDMTYDEIGTFYIGNGVGFRAGPDTMVVDSEIVGYEWISASAISVTSRGLSGTIARPHLAGARMFHPDSVFDYAISAGPVLAITDLMADGFPYTNSVTFLIGQNPTLARFVGRPPWVKVAVTDGPPLPDSEASITRFGNRTEINYGSQAETPTAADNILNDTGECAMIMEFTAVDEIVGVTIEADEVEVIAPGSGIDYTDARGVTTDSGKGWLAIGAHPIHGYPPHPGLQPYGSFTYRVGKNYADTLGRDGVIPKYYRCHVQFPGAGERALGVQNCTMAIASRGGSEGLDTSVFMDLYDLSQTEPSFFPHQEWPISGGTDNTISSPQGYFVEDIDIPDRFEQFAAFEIQFYLILNQVRRPDEVGWEIVNSNINVAIERVYWTLYLETPIDQIQPWQEVVSIFDVGASGISGSITSVKAVVTFQTYTWATNAELEIVGRRSSDPDDNTILWSGLQTGDGLSDYSIEVDVPVSSLEELDGYRIGVNQLLEGPLVAGVEKIVNTAFHSVEWTIDYIVGGVDTPDEERVVYATDLTATVTGLLGENPTPPLVIESLLTDFSPNGVYVDNLWFWSRHLEYLAEGYFFNGVFDGDIRLHEALKQCLFEGMCRFLFGEGYIRLLTYETYNNENVDFEITDDITFLRSKTVNNQATSTIKNDIAIFYDWNPASSAFDSTSKAQDEDSIVKYEIQDSRLEMKLIRSDYIAGLISSYNLERLSRPLSIYTVDVFLAGYPLQKGDKVKFKTIYRTSSALGFVAATTRDFGQGKSSKINKISLQISEPKVTGPVVTLSDSVDIVDSDFFAAGTRVHLEFTDSVSIKDDALTLALGIEGAGYGASAYGTGGYGE